MVIRVSDTKAIRYFALLNPFHVSITTYNFLCLVDMMSCDYMNGFYSSFFFYVPAHLFLTVSVELQFTWETSSSGPYSAYKWCA